MPNKRLLLKKISVIIFTLLLTAFSTFYLTNLYNEFIGRWEKIRVADECLYSEDGYIDYAEEVYLDVETYPDLAQSGLFWTKWDATTQSVIEVDADSAEGAALIDTTKPTIIMVHGMMNDGYYNTEDFILNPDCAVPSEFNLDTDNVSMTLLWMKQGWNVGYYRYERFAADGFPTLIEGKIWAIDGSTNSRYRHEDGTYTDNPTQYTMAEHFAAEYIRAMNYLPDDMGNNEIRLAAHSMGGELTTATIFLLTELADAQQLSNTQLPDRYAMLDPYFSTTILNDDGEITFYMGPKDITIRWSGKQLYKNNTGYTMIECLKDISANGIAIEYYTNEESFLKLGMPDDMTNSLKSVSTYSIVKPDYSGYNGNYSILMDGHDGVRNWYLCSIAGTTVPDVTDSSVIAMAASAQTPTSILLSLKGTAFQIVDGATTVNASDDTFIKIS